MANPNKARDSQRVVHLLRSKLDSSSNGILSSNNQTNIRPISQSSKLRNFSVMASSHYSGFSVKTKHDKYDQYLLDVENLDKVYGAVRDALGVERPEVVVERNEWSKEFEEKVLNDPEYREKILKKQGLARLRKEGNKTDSIFSKRGRETGRIGNSGLNSAGLTHNSSFKIDIEEPRKAPEKEEDVSLEVLNTRKRLGHYNFEVKRQAANKISYQVYAYIEKPKIVREKEVRDISIEDGKLVLEKENIEEETTFYLKKAEENPFVKVIIKEHNPFKKEEQYVPLKDEEINIEERMKKKWNPPDWMKFTARNARKTYKRPSAILNEVVDESDNKLRTTKASNMFGEYNDKKIGDNLHNLSVTSNFKQTTFDREYGISLKYPTLVTPEVKLPSLHEKVEERKRVFGKLKEDYSKKRDIKGELQKLLDSYNKMGGKVLRSQRSTARPRAITRANISNRPKLPKSEFQRQATKSFDVSPKGSNRANLINEDNTFHDEKYPTFLTQNIPLKKECSLREDLRDVSEEHSVSNNDVSVSQALDSSFNFDKSYYSSTGKANMSYDYKDKVLNKPSLAKGRDSVTKLHIKDHRRLISHENKSKISQRSGLSHINEDEDLMNNTFASKFKVQNQKETNRSFNPSSDNNEKRAKSIPVSCAEIEDRLNKTFTEFMNVKAQADNKFKAALSVLKKDRPITNQIRYAKYDTDKMRFSHIDRFREKAEDCRRDRYRKNEEQRNVYLEIADYVVSQELNETKLKACYFLMNFVKDVLERGDVLSAEAFSQFLNKIDDEKSVNNVFLGMLIRMIDKMKFRVEDIENLVLKQELEKYMKMIAKKREIQL